MALNILNFQNDQTGKCSYAIIPSSECWQLELASGTPLVWTVPDDVVNATMFFSYQGAPNVWVSFNGITPTLPNSGSIQSCSCVLNPAQRIVKSGDVITFLSGNTTDTVGWELLRNP